MNDDKYCAEECLKRKKKQKKITPQRLKNIALYYLKRFESSSENLKAVLFRRISLYAKENPDFDVNEAKKWANDIIADFERLHYLDDSRYAEIKIRGYLQSGKPERYIKIKLQQKGVDEKTITNILAQSEFDEKEMALTFAKKKKIGPFRSDFEEQKKCRQKDMGTLVRAGFSYDIVCDVLNLPITEE